MMKESKIYYPAFDYLRIILALVVALGHSGIGIWEPSAGYAVQVFFALSGWLIGGILVQSTPSDLPRFYFNRAARIWIPYLAAILLLVAVSLLRDRITPTWLETVFFYVTFVYNFFGPLEVGTLRDAMPLQGTGSHFWSICAEEQFYLLAPFLITLLSTIGRKVWFWSAIAAIALVSPYWIFFGAISLGVLASVLRRHLGDWQGTKPAQVILLAFSIVVFAGIYLDLIPYRIGAPFSSVSIILFLAQAGPHSGLAAFLGGVSFPMYLNHWMGVFIANAAFGKFGMRDTVICHLAAVIIAFVIAVILYMIIDRNVRTHRDKCFTPTRGKAVALCGVVLVMTGLIGGLLLIK